MRNFEILLNQVQITCAGIAFKKKTCGIGNRKKIMEMRLVGERRSKERRKGKKGNLRRRITEREKSLKSKNQSNNRGGIVRERNR